MGSDKNLSEAQVQQLHGNVNAGRQFSSASMIKNIQSMRNLGHTKRMLGGNLSGHKKLRPGNLGGAWFK